MLYSHVELGNSGHEKRRNRWRPGPEGTCTSRGRSPIAALPPLIAALLGVAGAGCRSDHPVSPGAETEIRALLDRQARDWNAGDIAGSLEGDDRSDRLRFQSGGDVTLGWQTVHDRYRSRYRDRAAMGRLTFSEVAIERLGAQEAMAVGRWRLQRAQDEPSGLFTLILRRTRQGGKDAWRIVHDHTSSK